MIKWVLLLNITVSTNAFLTAAHLFIENYRWVQPNDMIVSVARDDLTKSLYGKYHNVSVG